MKNLIAVLMLASLAVLAGCEGDGPCGNVECAQHVKPKITGPTYVLVTEPENWLVDWIDDENCFLLYCHSDAFVIDEVECDGCIVEVDLPGMDTWVPAKGQTIAEATAHIRVTAQTVGKKTLRLVLRSIEHEGNEIVQTVQQDFTADRAVSIAGRCMTGAHHEDASKIVATPCAEVRVAGNSFYILAEVETELGRTLRGQTSDARMQLAPAPTNPVYLNLEDYPVRMPAVEYRNPAPDLRTISLTGKYSGQTFTATIALPPAP